MARAEKISRIAVTFHVPEHSSPIAATQFLQRTVDELFDGAGSYVKLSEEPSEELMFALQTPLVNGSELMEEFFQRLRRLYSIAAAYKPHFTQLPELSRGRN